MTHRMQRSPAAFLVSKQAGVMSRFNTCLMATSTLLMVAWKTSQH